MSLLDLEWWAYLFIVLTFFIACLGLNYVVKKINEAKIDERFIRMLHKASTTQSTQVNGPLIVMETSKGLRQNSSKIAQPSPTGISLVFNQEENKRRKDLEDTFNIIKNSMDPKKFEALSLNTNKSQETLDVLPLIRSDRNINEVVPIKMIESAHKTHTSVTKETSSVTQSDYNGKGIETVLVKKNEYGHASTKETSSIDQSDCYVTEIITIKKNEFGYLPAKKASSTIRSDYTISEIVALKDTERIVAKETTFLIQSDSYDREKAPDPKNESTDESISIETEGTSSDGRSVNVSEFTPIKKNEPNKIVPKTNIPGLKLTESKIRDAINKAKENMDSVSLIKKTLDSTFLKIADTSETTNEDSQSNRAFTGLVPVKETVSKIYRSETELNPVKIRDSGGITATNALPPSQRDVKAIELCPVKLSDSGHSTAKDTSSHIQSYRNLTEKPLKINDSAHNVTKNISLHTHSDFKVTALCPVKMSDSDAAKNISSHTLSVHNITEARPVKPIKSGQLATKDTSLHIKSDSSVAKLSPAKNSERIADPVTSSHARNDRKANEAVAGKKEEKIESHASASHTQTNRNVTAIIPIKKNELGRIADQVTSSPARSDRKVSEDVTGKKDNLDRITTATASNTQTDRSVGKLDSAKKSEPQRIADQVTSTHAQSDRKEIEEVSSKKESDRITPIATAFHTQTDRNITKSDTAKKSQPGRIAVEATSLHLRSDRKDTEDVNARKESDKITPTATVSHTQTDHNASNSAKKSEPARTAAIATSSHAPSDRKVNDDLTAKKESDRITATATISHTQTDRTVTATISTKISEPEKVVDKGTSAHARSDRKESKDVLAKEEDMRVDHIAPLATASHTQTDRNITKVSHHKKKVSKQEDVRVTSSQTRSDYKISEDVTGKKNETGYIAASATASHTQTDHTVTAVPPVTMSARSAAKEIPTNTSSNRNMTELVPVTMNVPTNKSQLIEDEETASAKRSDIRINEPERITIKKSIPEISAIKKSNPNIESSSIVKKTGDTAVSKTTDANENPQTERSLKERLKALLTPPVMNEDVMILKPSSSTKK